MKKLVATIIILLAIFIGMYINQKEEIKNQRITAEEVEKIEEYIQKIYMWKEVTEEALPKFQTIEEAPEKWIWEVVKKNIEKYEDITSEEINAKAKELFGENLKKQISEKGNTSFEYNEEEQKYNATNIELDTDNDKFFINKIEKTKNGYEVEIIEYLEDYSEEPEDFIATDTEENNQEGFNIPIKNLSGEKIFTVKNSEGQSKIVEELKSNIDKFSKKKISLEKENDKIYITKVE